MYLSTSDVLVDGWVAAGSIPKRCYFATRVSAGGTIGTTATSNKALKMVKLALQLCHNFLLHFSHCLSATTAAMSAALGNARCRGACLYCRAQWARWKMEEQRT